MIILYPYKTIESNQRHIDCVHGHVRAMLYSDEYHFITLWLHFGGSQCKGENLSEWVI